MKITVWIENEWKYAPIFHTNDGKYHWKLNSCIYKWTFNSLASSAKTWLSIIFISVGSLNIRFCILFKNKSKKCKISMVITPLYTVSHLCVWENIKIHEIEWKKREKRTKNKLHLKHQTCAHVQQICSSIQHFCIVECLKPLTRVAIYTQIHLRLDGIKFVASPISIKLDWNNKYATCTRNFFYIFWIKYKVTLTGNLRFILSKTYFAFWIYSTPTEQIEISFKWQHNNFAVPFPMKLQYSPHLFHVFKLLCNTASLCGCLRVCLFCVTLIICIFNLIAINWSRQFEIGYTNIKCIKQHPEFLLSIEQSFLSSF